MLFHTFNHYCVLAFCVVNLPHFQVRCILQSDRVIALEEFLTSLSYRMIGQGSSKVDENSPLLESFCRLPEADWRYICRDENVTFLETI